jgi:hypothetical protein
MAKHHRKHKAEGGASGEKDFGAPRDDWKEEESSKPPVYAGKGHVTEEAEEKKHGGKAHHKRHKRKHGGATKVHKHHEHGEHMKHAKHLGHVKGEQHFPPAGKAPRKSGGPVARKSGGRTGSNFSPLSSAHAGEAPKDHRTTEID